MEILLLIGGIWLVKYLSDAQQFIKDVQFSFSDISLDFPQTLASGFTKLFLTVKISVKNDTDFEIKLLNIYSDVYYQDTLIGSITATGSIQINKRAVMTQKVPLTVNTANAIDVVKSIINNYSGVSFLFKGYADITLGRINFSNKQTLI
jgi:LEA14-like dessication related protein